MATWFDRIPRTTPAECDQREAKGMHITECAAPADPCNGFLGPLETYSCICWCHTVK